MLCHLVFVACLVANAAGFASSVDGCLPIYDCDVAHPDWVKLPVIANRTYYQSPRNLEHAWDHFIGPAWFSNIPTEVLAPSFDSEYGAGSWRQFTLEAAGLAIREMVVWSMPLSHFFIAYQQFCGGGAAAPAPSFGSMPAANIIKELEPGTFYVEVATEVCSPNQLLAAANQAAFLGVFQSVLEANDGYFAGN